MTQTSQLVLALSDWVTLFWHFLSLSLLSIGGAITTAPDMHRFLVDEQGWLTDTQFTAAIAIAQAAPGPNVLFVALIGWYVGLNAGGSAVGLLGVLISMTGILVPSTTLTYYAASWGHRHRQLRSIRAFKQGMAPIVVALLVATAWILSAHNSEVLKHWPLWLTTACTTLIVWRLNLHMLWLLGAGALLGWFGWV